MKEKMVLLGLPSSVHLVRPIQVPTRSDSVLMPTQVTLLKDTLFTLFK